MAQSHAIVIDYIKKKWRDKSKNKFHHHPEKKWLDHHSSIITKQWTSACGTFSEKRKQAKRIQENIKIIHTDRPYLNTLTNISPHIQK